jgi:hypothetical protein
MARNYPERQHRPSPWLQSRLSGAISLFRTTGGTAEAQARIRILSSVGRTLLSAAFAFDFPSDILLLCCCTTRHSGSKNQSQGRRTRVSAPH